MLAGYVLFVGLFGCSASKGASHAHLESSVVDAAAAKGPSTNKDIPEMLLQTESKLEEVSPETLLSLPAAPDDAWVSMDQVVVKPETALRVSAPKSKAPAEEVELERGYLRKTPSISLASAQPTHFQKKQQIASVKPDLHVPVIDFRKHIDQSVPAHLDYNHHTLTASAPKGISPKHHIPSTVALSALPPASVTVRPNAGKGPEVIQYSLFTKNFYGVNLQANSFAVDVVATYKWTDPRVVKLIPEGVNDITLSKKESELKVWLPGMAITNRDIKKFDLISTAVIINNKGEVTKVERAMAVIKNKYELNDYPFDLQNLPIKVASTKYMLNEVKLEAIKGAGGADKGLMEGQNYKLLDVGTETISETSGLLKKSRGVMTMKVERNFEQYTQSHLVPAGLLCCISWGVFFFPYAAPFITPRVALSILALLQLTYLTLNSAKALPPGSPYNWNDLLNQTALIFMFFCVTLNIFAEAIFHQFKLDELARAINHECKILIPFACITSLSTILMVAGPKSFLGISAMSAIIKIYILMLFGGYIGYSVFRVNAAIAQKRTLKDADAKPAK